MNAAEFTPEPTTHQPAANPADRPATVSNTAANTATTADAASGFNDFGPFHVVLNSGSGRHDASDTRERMAMVFAQGGREVDFHIADENTSIIEAARLAVLAAKKSGGVVVVAGGDGSINAVASKVLGTGCIFGVVPQGTFNYFGRNHAIAQDLEAATSALLRAKIEPTQVGRVNDRIFLVNASLGLYPQLLEDREAWKQKFGRSRFVAAFAGIATIIRSWKQLVICLELGGRAMNLETPTLFVGNNRLQLERVGVDEQDAASPSQGMLAAVLIKPVGSLALLGLMARGALGKLGDAENVQTFSLRKLTVRVPGHKRVKVATDGEITYMTSPLTFAVADEKLQLLVPSPQDRVAVE